MQKNSGYVCNPCSYHRHLGLSHIVHGKIEHHQNITGAALQVGAELQPLCAMSLQFVHGNKTISASKFHHDCRIRGKQSQTQSCQRHRITHFPTDAGLKCLSATLLCTVCSQLPNVMKTSCLHVQTAQSKKPLLLLWCHR